MRIAFPSEDKFVAQHFGHCLGFEIYEIENNNILDYEYIENPGHKPGFLPNFLADKGVNVIIAGGMGGGALDIFNERGVEVITGATGLVSDNVKKYLGGKLVSTNSVCQNHEHKDNCGNH